MQSAALQLCWPRQAAGAGGGPRRGGAGPGRPAGLLVYRPPTESLAGWASSMERLIPAGTKSLPVVLLELQQQERSSESLQLILLYYYCSRTTTVVKVLSTHVYTYLCVCVCAVTFCCVTQFCAGKKEPPCDRWCDEMKTTRVSEEVKGRRSSSQSACECGTTVW